MRAVYISICGPSMCDVRPTWRRRRRRRRERPLREGEGTDSQYRPQRTEQHSTAEAQPGPSRASLSGANRRHTPFSLRTIVNHKLGTCTLLFVVYPVEREGETLERIRNATNWESQVDIENFEILNQTRLLEKNLIHP